MKIKWFQGFALVVILSLAVSACGGLQPLNGEPAATKSEGTEAAPSGVEAEGDGPTVVTGNVGSYPTCSLPWVWLSPL